MGVNVIAHEQWREGMKCKIAFAVYQHPAEDREYALRIQVLRSCTPDSDPGLLQRLTANEPFEPWYTGMGGASPPFLPPADDQPSSVTTASAGVGQPLYDPDEAVRRIEEDPASVHPWWPKQPPRRRPEPSPQPSLAARLLDWLLG